MSTIQQIFQDHAASYLECFGDNIPEAHRRTIAAICECRTGLRGQHVFQCPECGEWKMTDSSCGNRHCPACQNGKAAEWVYRQQLKLLPCTYFLATFTVPEGLRKAARANQRTVYKAIMDCAASSLRTLEADKRFVGCNVAGFFGVLHTWGRQLQYHPHAHFVIPGGGLSKSRDRWIPANGSFLVHVRALSKMFRGKMRDALGKSELLHLIPQRVWKRDWVVHCEAVGNGRDVMKYLGAYVFRVAVSDSRIASYNGKSVVVRYQKVGSARWRHMKLSPFEFIRRYLQHVLPAGFMKVRHYGFLSPNFKMPVEKIRELICVLYEILRDTLPKIKPPESRPLRCPACNSIMRCTHFIPVTRFTGPSP